MCAFILRTGPQQQVNRTHFIFVEPLLVTRDKRTLICPQPRSRWLGKPVPLCEPLNFIYLFSRLPFKNNHPSHPSSICCSCCNSLLLRGSRNNNEQSIRTRDRARVGCGLLLFLFLSFSVLVANPKKLLYTVANPARSLLNRE